MQGHLLFFAAAGASTQWSADSVSVGVGGMSRALALRVLAVVVGVWFAAGAPGDARADNGLTTIDNPGGGQVVYGSLTGVTSLPGAMAVMLRTVHTRFGDRPHVDRIIRARDSRSVVAFFTVNEKQANGSGAKPIAGVVIVSMPAGSAAGAAVLYDDAARFRRTGGALMQKLVAAWHAASVPPAQTAPPSDAGASGGSDELVMRTGGDGTAGIGLPSGWRLTGVGGGRLSAEDRTAR